jgi:prolyl-tRNA editing enzyme YbaK/EbsC (Cys-tRNA(Pro) deacylase)
MPTVTEHLRSSHLAFELIPHGQTYTSIDEARAIGIDADEVLKSIVVKTISGYVLAVVSGGRRLDMRLVREATGDRHARLATEEELGQDFADFELGALSPLGSLLGIPTLIDTEVIGHETVVFAAGTQTESVKMRREDLFHVELGTVVPLARHPEDEQRDKEPVR